MPLLAEADRLLRYRYYKDLAPTEPHPGILGKTNAVGSTP
jgi:hypothetical protein